MQKIGLILVSLLFAQAASAAKLTSIKKLSNPALEKFSNAADKVDYLSSNAYKVVKATPKGNRSAEDIRLGTVEQAAHLLCGFFDDGVTLSTVRKSDAQQAVDYLIDNSDDSGVAPLKNAMAAVAKGDVEIYSGDASGNNTSGTVLGVYDVKTDQILVIANTNCGSDD